VSFLGRTPPFDKFSDETSLKGKLRLLPDLRHNAAACIAVTFRLPGYVTIQGIRIAGEDSQGIQSE
jgi:hypothetical protein